MSVIVASPVDEETRRSAPQVFGSVQAGALKFVLMHDFTERQFDELLLWAHGHHVSDLKIQSGDYIMAQVQGLWQAITDRRLELNEVESILRLKYGTTGPTAINKGEDLNFVMTAKVSRDEVINFRANATRSRVGAMAAGMSLTCRAIPGLPPEWSALGIESEISQAMFPRYGLILVVGTTGSGKSTFMASSVRERLEHGEPAAIGTFEKPVEYTFGDLGLGRMPLVSQVQIGVGEDLLDFSRAGPNAMRRKFDVIIAGEMSDVTSIKAGLELAETGHAVMATLHVDTPAEAVSRIVDFFPAAEQPSVASKLRSALRLIVAQKLVRNTRGTRTAVRAWTVFDREVKNKLSSARYSDWQHIVEGINAARSTNFEERALPHLVDGTLDLRTYCEVAGLTRDEAVAYALERGFDASHLD